MRIQKRGDSGSLFPPAASFPSHHVVEALARHGICNMWAEWVYLFKGHSLGEDV